MQPIVVSVGPLAASSANNIALAQSGGGAGNLVLNGTLVSGGVATLDTPRTVLITTTDNEATNKFTIQGTDWAGFPITETITGPNNTTGASVLSYKTVTKILNSANITSNVTVGTTTTAYSPWVRFDSWSVTPITKAVVVSAAPLAGNFTVQVSMDDPNSLVNSVDPANMTWFSDPDTNFVGKTASAQGSSSYIPTWMRILLNSGNATVTGTFSQAGSVPY
jgi:hypothetical protein